MLPFHDHDNVMRGAQVKTSHGKVKMGLCVAVYLSCAVGTQSRKHGSGGTSREIL